MSVFTSVPTKQFIASPEVFKDFGNSQDVSAKLSSVRVSGLPSPTPSSAYHELNSTLESAIQATYVQGRARHVPIVFKALNKTRPAPYIKGLLHASRIDDFYHSFNMCGPSYVGKHARETFLFGSKLTGSLIPSMMTLVKP